MKIILKAAAFCLSLINFNATAGGYVDAGDINVLLFYKGHDGLLLKHQFPSDPDKCGRWDYYVLPDNHPHFQQIYAMLLAAQTAGKKVSFYVDGCHQGIPAIANAQLDKQ